MALQPFEFQQQFRMITFLIMLTQFKKIGLFGKTFITVWNLKINFNFRNYKLIKFLCYLYLFAVW